MMNNQKYQTQIPLLIQEILTNRGIVGLENQKAFLFPNLANLPSPGLMLNLEKGAHLAINYLLKRKNIIIWGDYDVDGTTGTALLVLFFRLLGVEATYHIPNRLIEGYGLNIDWFLANSNKLGGEFLLITVDCGIGDTEVIEQIQAIGGDVIVTDHHLIPKVFNPKCITINPAQSKCGFHHEHLAGVGVAFYLAASIRQILSKKDDFKDIYTNINLKQLLPLVALGTLSDIVPLTSVNRTLVRAGMEAIVDCGIPGLASLLKFCQLGNSEISSEEVGFLIGPRINAAGRLGKSRIVVDLLIERKTSRANKLSSKLLEMNDLRRDISDGSLDLALTNISTNQVKEDGCLIVINKFHKGVAGIVASRLVDMFKVPVVLLCGDPDDLSGELLTGSARSIEGINILEIFTKSSLLLEKFGGHSMAAGLTLQPQNIDKFVKEFKNNTKLAVELLKNSSRKPLSNFKCTIDELLNDDVMHFYKLLEPFGPENPQPIFKTPNAIVIDSRVVGQNNAHLSLTLRTKYSKVKGIGFNLGYRITEVQSSPRRDILFTPTLNRFRGTTSWQLRVVDI